MTTLAQTLADIQAEIERQKASGNLSPLVAGIIANEAAERAEVDDLTPDEWDLVDDEAQLRALPGYYDGF
ncbi:hypothetical protein [Klebsiella phage vB_KpnS_IME279]|uniref:Uncharacterized protein n=1 Tax=Klebsiella phage vB_KpnS_IME279 TaxID=2041211 RepID=A0A291LBK6_9CAUD|nr:hypothetical protein HOS15_gp51 [Klebsiella phage vB_KpnS_IME279]ATI16445.1 hypothetical protein [Klebsiella phage vB_KpnS_IME279]